MEATQHLPEFVASVHREFERIGHEQPELVRRYWEAFGNRDAGEMEKLLVNCQNILRENQDGPWIGNLRINAVTGRFHVGNGNRNAPLFASAIRFN